MMAREPRNRIHTHHWAVARDPAGVITYLCPCGLSVDWTAVRYLWEYVREKGYDAVDGTAVGHRGSGGQGR